MNLQDLSHQQLYDELEKVIRRWQELDYEWQKRYRFAKENISSSSALGNAEPDLAPTSSPFAQLLPDPDPDLLLGNSDPSPSSGFDSGGGESGGAGSTGDW